jgi:hypothetical protein
MEEAATAVDSLTVLPTQIDILCPVYRFGMLYTDQAFWFMQYDAAKDVLQLSDVSALAPDPVMSCNLMM